MSRVLVTGGTGFIGRHTLPFLSEKGFEVHAIGRTIPAVRDQAEWHCCDLLDSAATAAIVERLKPTHLLHLAWYAEHGLFWNSPLNLDWIAATLKLLRAFRDAGGHRVTIAGTCAEYDWTTGETLDEDRSPLKPASLYGASKNCVREITESFARLGDMSVAWGRVFFLYGPHEATSRLVPSVARALLKGELANTTRGTQRRDFLHSTDVANAFVSILDSAVAGSVNIGSGQPVAVADVVRILGQLAGREDLLRIGSREPASNEPDMLLPNVRRLHREVGWTPRLELRDGLEQTLEWWRAELNAQ